MFLDSGRAYTSQTPAVIEEARQAVYAAQDALRPAQEAYEALPPSPPVEHTPDPRLAPPPMTPDRARRELADAERRYAANIRQAEILGTGGLRLSSQVIELKQQAEQELSAARAAYAAAMDSSASRR
jgi:hypothetical protein